MILLLRGHIRLSFSNYYLKNLIKEIYNEDKDLVIYISTFNIIQNSTSWRKIATINTKVTEEMIKNYFKELSFLIKKIIIIDDSKIELIGNTVGNVCKTSMPLIGWKRYWYGKYQIINYINETFENKNEVVLNLMFDVFSNPDGFVEMYAGLFNNANVIYREAFWSNDLASMPIQYIIVSHFSAPENFAHLFNSIETEYPSIEDFVTVLAHINSSSNNQLVTSDYKAIASSALGLSETEFINLALTSVLETGEVSADYIYEQKMSSVKKNGILEIIKPQITFDNIGGLDFIKDLIARNANLWHNPEQAKQFGISPIRRMLMVGIPGTGKSAICEATANALGLDLARTGISQVMNSYIGQSEANMRAVFKQINAMAPLCVWIDEFGRDLSGGQSSSQVDGGTTDRVHGEFLTGLQELPENVFLMCAANQLEHLKPEMLRADRFDKILFVGLPSLEERQSIFSIYLSGIDTPHVYNTEALANATQYFTGAEIKSLISEVKFFVSSSELRAINTQDILSHVSKMRNILWNKLTRFF